MSSTVDMPAQTTGKITLVKPSTCSDKSKTTKAGDNSSTCNDQIPSTSKEQTNGIKRTLQNKTVDNNEVKKLKLNNDNGKQPKKNEPPEGNSKDFTAGVNHFNVDTLIEHIYEFPDFFGNIGENENSNVSKKTHLKDNCSLCNCSCNKTDSEKINASTNSVECIDDNASNVGNKEDSVSEISTNCKNKSSENIELITLSCTSNLNKTDDKEINRDNEDKSDENDTSLISNESCSDKLVIVENEEQEDNDVDVPGTSKIISLTEEDPVVEDAANVKDNITKPSSIESNIILIEENVEKSTTSSKHSNDMDFKNINDVIEIDTDDNSNDKIDDITIDHIDKNNDCLIVNESDSDSNSVVLLSKDDPLFKEKFSGFFRQNSIIDYENIESCIRQKIIEFMVEKQSFKGTTRIEAQTVTNRDNSWKLRYKSLLKQVKELRAVIFQLQMDLNENKNARPHKFTRTVGLQAVLSSEPKKSDLNSSDNKSKESKGVCESNNEGNDNNTAPIIITEIDDLEETSTSQSTNEKSSIDAEKTTNIEEVPKVPDIVTAVAATDKAPSPVKEMVDLVEETVNLDEETVNLDEETVDLVEETVNLVEEEDTIDLTLLDDDEVVEASRVRYKKPSTPVKIIQRTMHSPPTSSPTRLIINTPSQIMPENVYLGLPSTSGNIIVRTNATSRSQIQPTVMPSFSPLTTRPILKPLIKPYIVKNGKILSVSVSSVAAHKQLQATPIRLTSPHNIHQRGSVLGFEDVPAAIPIMMTKHPVPLPNVPYQRSEPLWKMLPPAPTLTVAKTPDTVKGVILSWNVVINRMHAEIVSYHIFGYQEVNYDVNTDDLWRLIGDVNALPLPMACSLTQFMPGHKYHFAVRAIDIHARIGPFSLPQSVYLT